MLAVHLSLTPGKRRFYLIIYTYDNDLLMSFVRKLTYNIEKAQTIEYIRLGQHMLLHRNDVKFQNSDSNEHLPLNTLKILI